jgi:hypothetical protein
VLADAAAADDDTAVAFTLTPSDGYLYWGGGGSGASAAFSGNVSLVRDSLRTLGVAVPDGFSGNLTISVRVGPSVSVR